MPKRSSKPKPKPRKPPADVNALGRFLVDQATAEPEDGAAAAPLPEKNPAAVALGRLGGLKGGQARAAALSKKKRSSIAKKAAQTRWAKRDATEQN